MFNKEELKLIQSAIIDAEFRYTKRYFECDEDEQHYAEVCKDKASRLNKIYYKIKEELNNI